MAQLLSICIGVRGRISLPWEGSPTGAGGVLALLPRCVRSLASALQASGPALPPTELVLAHWPVPGEPYPGDWLPDACGGLSWRVVTPGGEYNRGRGRNEAARAAVGDALFFLDSDMLVPPGLVERGLHWLQEGKVFMPRYRRFTSPQETRHVAEHGTGNVFLTRRQWLEFPWPEYPLWGFEDTEMWRYWMGKRLVVREGVEGFLHQWHPLAEDHKSRRSACPSPA